MPIRTSFRATCGNASSMRMLAIDREILLIDEPCSVLDVPREIMQTELMHIWEKSRKTVQWEETRGAGI